VTSTSTPHVSKRAPDTTRLGAAGLVVISSLSAQIGATYAFHLFSLTSPTMAAWLRNLVGAAVLVGIVLVRGGGHRVGPDPGDDERHLL
jgi:threonine/homoserine efflux transporter RhtA